MTTENKYKVTFGDRVLLVGQHFWVGYSGTVIEGPNMMGFITVELDNGLTVTAAPRQWKQLRQP